MSLTQIIDRFYSNYCIIERRAVSTDSLGDVLETWNVIAENVPITIQALKITERAKLQEGKTFTADFKAYIPTGIIEPKKNDRIIMEHDEYEIIAFEKYEAARSDISIGHHYKIFLRIYDAQHS